MPRRGEHLLCRSLFDEFAGVEYGDPGRRGRDVEVVGDQKQGQVVADLPGSRPVTLHNDYSHGVFASRGNACVDEAAAAYLGDGTVAPADVHCAGPGLPTP